MRAEQKEVGGLKTCKKCGALFEKETGHLCSVEKAEVESYIRSQPEEVQPLLREIRETILSVIPDAKEKISWKMPTFYKTHDIMHFAAFKNHWGLYPGPAAIEEFKERFQGLKYSKGAVQFSYDQPLDKKLIQDMTQWCDETGNHH